MTTSEYHKRIIKYYSETEFAYKDSWDLDNSLAIHYGYWDQQVKTFPESLIRMNEVMAEAAGLKYRGNDRPGDFSILDAGCGIGGSSIFIASAFGIPVTGISLSERQVEQAKAESAKRKLDSLTSFEVMDYCNTRYPDNSFDIVWGCESICYAADKKKFIDEAYRLLKAGGTLVVADGFVTRFENNDHPTIRKWLDGWQVNYLETPSRFINFMQEAGFTDAEYKNISLYTLHSSKRLLKFYYLASLYLLWKKITFSRPATEIQKKNIQACKYQYEGLKKGLWQYGMITGKKL